MPYKRDMKKTRTLQTKLVFITSLNKIISFAKLTVIGVLSTENPNGKLRKQFLYQYDDIVVLRIKLGILRSFTDIV